MRCGKEIKKGQRCIVPVDAKGDHTDGNATHYNGPSHFKESAFVRG